MRRLGLILLAAAVGAAFLATGALAKEGGVELSSTPSGLNAGDKWTPTLHLIDGTPEMIAAAKPGITIRNGKTGRVRNFAAKPTDKPGVYTVDVVFPAKGFWTYEASDGVAGRAYEFPVVYIDAPAAAPATPITPAGDTSAFPVWPAVGGGLAFLLAVLGTALALRQLRLGLQH